MRGLHDRHQLANGRVNGAQTLGYECLAGRQVGQLLDLLRREDPALDEPTLDVELQPRRADELVDQLRGKTQVVVAKRDGDRAFELGLQRGHTGGFRGAPGQRVLHDAVLDVTAAKLAAQLLDLTDGQAAIVGETSAFGLLPLLAWQLDLPGLLCLPYFGSIKN